MNTKSEIRAIITDQINRHVAIPQDHRDWLANDISTRVEQELSDRAIVAAKNIATRGEAGDLTEDIILEYLRDYLHLS